jgi:hypothetical protein
VEVHVFAESLRGLGEGHYPWDLEGAPNMMTNANIAKVEEVGADRVLKLDYQDGEQTITIPRTPPWSSSTRRRPTSAWPDVSCSSS